MQAVTQQCKKPNAKNASSRVNKQHIYEPTLFGLDHVGGDGSGVKICVIDSGYVKHKDMPNIDMAKVSDFTQKSSKPQDSHGHATAVAGIIAANNPKQIRGIAPKANLYYAKALDDSGNGEYNALISSILWSIVKEVDIIVMSFGGVAESQMLYDVIDKAYSHNICMFAANGSSSLKTASSSYPAKFDSVFSVGMSPKIDKPQVSAGYSMFFPSAEIQTLFLDDKYIRLRGSSFYNAVVAGTAARIISEKKKSGRCSVSDVYKTLRGLAK